MELELSNIVMRIGSSTSVWLTNKVISSSKVSKRNIPVPLNKGIPHLTHGF
jgi:hypothetical protein